MDVHADGTPLGFDYALREEETDDEGNIVGSKVVGYRNPRRDQDEGGFYIHVADPSFADPPWPGQRRLGPYVTYDEALAQAVNDAATGYGAAIVGIYSEEESLQLQAGERVKATLARSEIKKRGAAESKKRAKLVEMMALTNTSALNAHLAEAGLKITAEELLAAGVALQVVHPQ